MKHETSQLVRDYKNTFSGEAGKRVLAHLKSFCLSNNNQTMFDPTSSEQTAYNLGANSVYRYIQMQVDRVLDDTPEICQTEPTDDERNQS